MRTVNQRVPVGIHSDPKLDLCDPPWPISPILLVSTYMIPLGLGFRECTRVIKHQMHFPIPKEVSRGVALG